MADNELAAKLQRRQDINECEEGEEPPAQLAPSQRVWNPYTEFKEFSRKEIQQYQKSFKMYDVNGDRFIDLEELKRMMEKLGAPQTHLGLKQMIKEVDEDGDSQISFREFLLIFRKAAAGELLADSGLSQLANLMEIDVHEVGVGGAKTFFEAKIEEMGKGKKFEEEIKQEQEERKRQLEEQKVRKQEFRAKAALFQQPAAAGTV